MKRFEGFQKGVNLGGWISQYYRRDEEYFNTFITEEDIEEIAALGFDHVRVPVDYNVLEDEDGNVIGRKKGKEKLEDYEKQIREYFKDSDIKPNFHSMLGEYGDKDNERR